MGIYVMPTRVSAAEVSSIETSNVLYDLRVLYGGENYLGFNPETLYPNENTDKELSFKFLCAKPVGSSLYLYLYTYREDNLDVINGVFNISLSKQQKADGTFSEVFTDYVGRFINSSGYQGRFMKFCIDNLVNLQEDTRIYINSCYIQYKLSNGDITKSSVMTVRDELFFSPTEGEDFVYNYFKDDYVRITDGEVSLLLTQATREGSLTNVPTSFNEDFYYFFTTDKDIEELVEVQYDYTLVTYKADMTFAECDTMILSSNGSCYAGLSDGKKNGNFTYQASADKIEITDSMGCYNNRIEMGSYLEEVERPYFLWWNQKVCYQVNNIQNARDLSNLNTTGNEAFIEYVNNIQGNRVKNNKEKYHWLFKVHSGTRESVKYWQDMKWWYIFLSAGGTCYDHHSTSVCHEVKQTVITWLHFRTDNQEFSLNALDIPKDTTGLEVQNVPFETLSDLTIRKFREAIDKLQGTDGKDILNSLAVLLGLAMGILVIYVIGKVLVLYRTVKPK